MLKNWENKETEEITSVNPTLVYYTNIAQSSQWML